MKHSILYLMTAAVLLAGCAKEVDKTQVPEIPAGMHAVTITASVDNPETRTSVEIVNKKGIYSWQENEQIAVVETLTGDKNGILPFQILDQENGTFTGSMTDGKSLVFAVTPKGALTEVECTDEKHLAFTLSLSGTYNFSDGTNAVMVAGLPTYAEGSENPHFTFQHAAALYRVVYENVPVGTAALHFVANEPITGDFIFDSLEGVEIVQSESGQDYADVLLGAPVSSPNTTLTFYVPVPTGNYADVTVSLLDKDLDAANPIANTTRSFEAAADYPVSKGQIVRIPKITLAPVVAPAGTILFSEPFTGFEADAQPTVPGTGATVYNNATVTYSCGSDNTKVYNNSYAGCDAPELLVSKSNGAFTIFGIPTGGNTTLTVSWYSNNSYIDLYYGENEVSLIADQVAPYQAVLTVPEGTSTVDICFKNTNKNNNGRLDNIVVTAGAPLQPAGLAFENSEVQAILGEDFVEPALANEHGLSVTYASSDPDVAEVDSEGNVTVKAIGDATITVSSEPTEEYAQGQASYTIHVAAAVLTIDATTNPVKAECKEDATVTFGVQSNIEWVPSVEEDVNDIVKNISVNEENTVVTVTFNKNEDAQNEKTAVIAITPANEVHAALKKTITVTQEKFMNVDVLTYARIGITGGNGYTSWSGVEGTVSGAVYAGNSNAGNNITYIQLRNTSPSGIVTTESGGVVRKVEIDWSTSQNTTNGRYVTVYGSNTAYTGPVDLYNEDKRGKSLGTIVKGTSTELTIDGDYAYVGLLANGALYIDEIRITWGTVDPNAPKFGASIDGDANIAADVTTGTINVTGNVAWNASADNGATVSPSSGNGVGTITVTMPENESYTDPANYVVTVSTAAEVTPNSYQLTFTQAPAVNPNQNDGTLEKPYNASEALTILNGYTSGQVSSDWYYIRGKISSIDSYNSKYSSITYFISDDGTENNQLEVYSGKNIGNTSFSSVSDLAVGDDVIVYGQLKDYNGTKEIYQNNYLYSKNGITKLLTSIAVSGQTTSFTTEDQFSFGGTVTATYTDDSTADVTSNAVFSGYDLSNSGNQTVTVSYTENGITKTTSYSISVANSGANEVTYTQNYSSSGNTVATSGIAPGGSNCSWTTTYTNSNQLTSGKSMTYTLTGYAGKTIIGLTLHLKTNSKTGTGSVSMKHGNTEFGTYDIPVIGGTYTDKEATVTATTIGENETVTVTISAEVNSVYCDHITITWN